MSTKGFEYAYSLGGHNRPPAVRLMPFNGTGAFVAGDLLVVQSSGKLARAAAGVTEVTAVCLENITANVDGALHKVAVIQKGQVWRCSGNATSTAAVGQGYTKTLDITDQKTVKVSTTTGGTLAAFDVSSKDDAGNVLAYVTFTNTTF